MQAVAAVKTNADAWMICDPKESPAFALSPLN